MAGEPAGDPRLEAQAAAPDDVAFELGAVEQPGLGAELSELDRRAAGRAIGRKHGEQLAAQERDAPQALVARHHALVEVGDDHDVHVTARDRRNALRRLKLAQLHVQAGVLARDAAGGLDHERTQRDREGGHAHRPRRVLTLTAQGLLGVADAFEDLARVRRELETRFGQRHAAPVAHQQRGAALLLQRRELLGDRGWAHRVLGGHGADGAESLEADEQVEAARVQHCAEIPYSRSVNWC